MSSRYEVIETKVWKRDDGVIAIPFAVAKTRRGVPWTKPAEEKRWELVKYFTVRDNATGAIGTPSPYESPWPTRAEAEAWVDAEATASKRHHATKKKSPAKLQREIDEALTQAPSKPKSAAVIVYSRPSGYWYAQAYDASTGAQITDASGSSREDVLRALRGKFAMIGAAVKSITDEDPHTRPRSHSTKKKPLTRAQRAVLGNVIARGGVSEHDLHMGRMQKGDVRKSVVHKLVQMGLVKVEPLWVDVRYGRTRLLPAQTHHQPVNHYYATPAGHRAYGDEPARLD